HVRDHVDLRREDDVRLALSKDTRHRTVHRSATCVDQESRLTRYEAQQRVYTGGLEPPIRHRHDLLAESVDLSMSLTGRLSSTSLVALVVERNQANLVVDRQLSKDVENPALRPVIRRLGKPARKK